MAMKKITRNMIIMACAYGTSVSLTTEINEINQPQEVSSLSQDVVDPNEYAIIVEGGASYGNSAVTGKACVVTSLTQLKERMRKNKRCIVVMHDINNLCRGTLELGAVIAIIIEKGDESSYVLELGKKWNIPVIVGATDATKKIIDGQIITCDPVTRNVYHVAYPDHKEFRFDVLHMPLKDNKHQTLHDELIKIGNVDSQMEKNDELLVEKGGCPTELERSEHRGALQNSPGYSTERTKNFYRKHFNGFKDFVLSEKTWYERTKWCGGIKAVEAGARIWEKYDDIAVDCICLAASFIESSKGHIVEKLKKVGESDECIQQIDSLIDACKKKPWNLNYAAGRAYEQQLNYTQLPNRIKKEDLIGHPRKYKEIQNELDEDQQDEFTIIGYFIRYLFKNKLSV